MNATELIKYLQCEVNKHGDFPIKVSVYDDECSLSEEFTSEDSCIKFIFDDRNNEMYGGWICATRESEDDED